MGHGLLTHRAKSYSTVRSLQFIKFIASSLYGNLSLCCAVVSKSTNEVIGSPVSVSRSVCLFVYFSRTAKLITVKLGQRVRHGTRKHLHYLDQIQTTVQL